ncbi:MAG: hypothetical protein AAB110_09665, partial [Candidatus Desantisbacteria bacterium]
MMRKLVGQASLLASVSMLPVCSTGTEDRCRNEGMMRGQKSGVKIEERSRNGKYGKIRKNTEKECGKRHNLISPYCS